MTGKPFPKGHIPWNKNTKGIMKPNSGSFKKGNKGFWKGKKRPNISGKNSSSWKGGPIKKICIICKKEFFVNLARKKTAKYCSLKCRYIMQTRRPAFIKGRKFPERAREKCNFWKGGKSKDSYGYILIYKPEHPFCAKFGYVRQSRLIVEEQIGRYLKIEEPTHHINEIKDDNRPENLMAFVNNSVHIRFHHNPANVKPSEIIFDGRSL